MKKRLVVDTSEEAEEQILVQVLYIAEDSINNALAWEDRLRAAVKRIGDMPVHAIDEDATARLGRTVRKTVFEGTYLIHYHIDETRGVVRIINFRHGARMPRRGEP